MREEYVRHRDNDQGAVDGIASTAKVITAAALIMISVFLAFVLGEDPFAGETTAPSRVGVAVVAVAGLVAPR